MKCFRNSWFVGLGFLVLIKPGVISGMPALSALDSLIDVSRLVLIFFTVIAFINIKVKLDRKLIVGLLILAGELWELVSTSLNGGTYSSWGSLMNTCGITLFTYLCLFFDVRNFLKSLSYLLGWYVIINTITVFLFPDGMYESKVYTQNFFLSYRTAWFIYYYLAIFVTFLWYEVNHTKKTRKWLGLVIFCAYLSMLRQWTATALFCISLMLLVLYIFKRRRKCFTARTVIVTEIVAFIGIVFFQMQNYLSFIIETLLGKDLTLSSRVRIWSNAIDAIQGKELLGYGNMDPIRATSLLGYGVDHAHSYYLNTILYYGIIGLVIGLVTLVVAFSGKNAKNHMQGSNDGRNTNANGYFICIAALIALMTGYQVEAMMSIGYYLTILFLVSAEVCEKGLTHDK